MFSSLAVRQIDLELEYPCSLLHQLCYLMESTVGGTSGALYAIFFAAMAKSYEVMFLYHTLTGKLVMYFILNSGFGQGRLRGAMG